MNDSVSDNAVTSTVSVHAHGTHALSSTYLNFVLFISSAGVKDPSPSTNPSHPPPSQASEQLSQGVLNISILHTLHELL